nr:unnamed protein product [Digitaria exilis]
MYVEMNSKKPYVVALIIQVINAGMFVILKAAFNRGLNTFVFNFYCQAAASVLLLPIAFFRERKNMSSMTFGLLFKIFLFALIGHQEFAGASPELDADELLLHAAIFPKQGASPSFSSFSFAPLLKLKVKNKQTSLLLALHQPATLVGVVHILEIETPGQGEGEYGPDPVVEEATFEQQGRHLFHIRVQAALLKEYPNKMLVTVTQCVFSTFQSLVVAAVAERDMSRWKLGLDVSLLAIIYTVIRTAFSFTVGFLVTGVSNYLQVWCLEVKGPVFVAAWFPLCFVFTLFCSSFFLGEIVRLGSILGGILLVGGLYSMLWGKSKETMIEPCSEVKTMFSAQDEKEETKPEENNNHRKKQEDEVSAYAVEQV